MTRPELGPWLTPGLLPRLLELYEDERLLSYKVIAEMLSDEFGLDLPRNAVVGKIFRLKLPTRPPRVYARKEKEKVPLPILAPIEPRLPPRKPNGISIYQLRDGDCKWTDAELMSKPPFRYCGKPVARVGESWCKAHRPKVFVKTRESAG